MANRVVALLLGGVAWFLAFSGSALAVGVPINPFGRPGDLHIDFPTYAAQQQAGTSGDNDFPPEALLRTVGDVNGDGRPDLAMAISSSDASWTAATWVSFMPGLFPATINVSDPAWAGLKIVGASQQISGIAGLGDVNGDGFGDIAVAGASGAWVIFGGPASATIDVSALGDRGFTIKGLHPCYPAGGGNLWTGVFSRTSSVLAIGDQNGDGRPDLAVCDLGGIRVIYTPAMPAGAVIDATQLGSGGATLASPSGVDGPLIMDTLGDMDGDGRNDIVVGWSQQSKEAHVLATPLPAAGTSVPLSEAESSPRAWALTAANVRMERFVSIGDDNGDGRRDVSLSLIDQAGRHQMVIYGETPGSHQSLFPLSDSIGHAIEDRGNGVGDVGDQDGDGRADLAYDASVRLSSTGQDFSIDQSLPDCVTLKRLSDSASLVLCSLEYKIAGTLPDFNLDGKPEIVAIHADPLPVEAGVTRATWSVDVFQSATTPVPQALEAPVALPGGSIDFTGQFLTAPTAPSRSLAVRATVAVTDGSGHVATATGSVVDAGAAATTRATVQADAARLGLVAGRTYDYRMSLLNGRGLTGTTELSSFTYRPAAAPVPGKRITGKRIVGTRRADRLRGTAGPDTLLGRGGNDLLRGLGGDDRLEGGSGNDRLDGGSGNDRITGGPGRDRLRGGAGSDQVFAADGRPDVVYCGLGTDVATLDRHDRAAGCERIRRR